MLPGDFYPCRGTRGEYCVVQRGNPRTLCGEEIGVGLGDPDGALCRGCRYAIEHRIYDLLWLLTGPGPMGVMRVGQLVGMWDVWQSNERTRIQKEVFDGR